MSNAPLTDPGQQPIPRVRVWLILAVTTFGLALIALGVIGDARWHWKDSWPSLFIEVGSAVGLLAVLVGLERAFFRRETAALERRVEAKQSALEDRIADRIEKVESALATVGDQAEQLRTHRHDDLSTEVNALREELTETKVVDAIAHAAKVNAVRLPIYVRANTPTDAPRIKFQIHTTEYGEYWQHARRDSLQLMASVFLPGSGPLRVASLGLPGRHETFLLWRPEETAADFFDQIVGLLEQERIFRPGLLDARVTFENLILTLDSALSTRPAAGGPHELAGPVVERFDNGWYITAHGIENPEHGFLLPADYTMRASPAKPEFIDDDVWTQLLGLAIEYLRPPLFPPGVTPGA